jgi:T3SS negative regulator,GrlR
MHRDGRYAAWFRTPRGEGTGIVQLANGRISGGDSFFTYSGSYEVDDDRFTAALKTTRYAEGPPTLFGIDEVEVELAGTFKGRMATCSGTARQAPGVTFAATLIASEDVSAGPDGPRTVKLPAASDSRNRARNSLVRGLSRV